MPPTKQVFLPGQRQARVVLGTDAEEFTLDDVFGSRFEGAVIMREVTLSSEDIRKLVRRDYLYLSKMLHTVTRAREYRGIEHGPLNKIEQGLQEKIDSIFKLIDIRLIAMQKRFNQAPDSVAEVTPARTTRFDAPVASPYANRYLDLLLAADNFVARATACWLQGLINSQEFSGGTREIKRALHTVKADVTKARAACFQMMERISANLPANDQEGQQMRQDVAAIASALVKDAIGDSEVQELIPVSTGHDLERVANADADAALAPAEAATS